MLAQAFSPAERINFFAPSYSDLENLSENRKKTPKTPWKHREKPEFSPKNEKNSKKRKKVKKISKKVLTKEKKGGIIPRLRKSAATIIENWTTRDEYKARSWEIKIVCETNLAILEENTTQTKSKVKSKSSSKDWITLWGVLIQIFREFDPGSGWTLAACITHSSRTDEGLRPWVSGGRVSNAWATCLTVRDNVWKRPLIPYDASGTHVSDAKDLLL